MILEVSASGFSKDTSGGGERYFSGLAEYVSSNNVGISWSSTPKRGLGKSFAIGDYGMFHFNIPGILQKTNPIPTIRTLVEIKDILTHSKNKVDVIHIHNYRTMAGAIWTVLSKYIEERNKVKLILTDHGSMFAPFPRYLLRKFDYYAPVSDFSNTYLQNLMPKPSKIIKSFVKDEFLKLNVNKTFEDRVIDILFVGRIAPWKGVERVLYLARTLKENGFRDLNVRIVGNSLGGTYKNALDNIIMENKLSNNVKIVTGTEDRDLINYYNSSKIFVHAGSDIDVYGKKYHNPELSSSSIIEAMSFGLPILATSTIPVVNEANSEGGKVFAIVPGEYKAQAEIAENLLDNKSAWNEIHYINQKYIAAKRTLSHIGKEFLKFVSSIEAGDL
ncbi:MAG: glycosyltransferase family 4 protein [Thermoplasmatales archaeon]